MNKKGLTTLKELMVGVAILVFCTAGLIMFNADISINYAVNYTDYGGINNTAEIDALTQEVYNDIQGATESPFGAAYYAIKGGWDSFRLMFKMVNIGNEIYSNTTDVSTKSGIPIPSFVTGLVIVMISLILIFAALSYIGKTNV